MRRIILSAGHSSVPGKDRGAEYKDNIEGVLTAKVRNDLFYALIADDAQVLIDNDDTELKDSIAYFKDQVEIKDIAIDIHFNSFAQNTTVGGTEVIIPDDSSPFEETLALELSTCMASSLKIKNRGVKRERETAHKRLGWMRLKCETVLLEICFLSNDQDMEAYNKNYWNLINRLCKSIIYFANNK